MTESTTPTWRWPSADLAGTVDRYFDYLHHGMRVNRDLAHAWVDATTVAFDGGRAQISTFVEAFGSHGQAVEEWLEGLGRTVGRVQRQAVGSPR